MISSAPDTRIGASGPQGGCPPFVQADGARRKVAPRGRPRGLRPRQPKGAIL